MSSSINRRSLLKQVITGSAAMATGVVIPKSVMASVAEKNAPLKGNINHSVCKWCYNDIPY